MPVLSSNINNYNYYWQEEKSFHCGQYVTYCTSTELYYSNGLCHDNYNVLVFSGQSFLCLCLIKAWQWLIIYGSVSSSSQILYILSPEESAR